MKIVYIKHIHKQLANQVNAINEHWPSLPLVYISKCKECQADSHIRYILRKYIVNKVV